MLLTSDFKLLTLGFDFPNKPQTSREYLLVNRVTLVGRLGKDPELRYSPSGQAVARFSLATDESRKDQQGNWQQETTWHNIILWGAAAERAGEQLKKGNLVYIEGKISQRQWEDKEGQKRTSFEIVGFTLRNLTPRSHGESSGESAASASQMTPPPPMQDEDLPF
jgi:single-strand DNA-binding protein